MQALVKLIQAEDGAEVPVEREGRAMAAVANRCLPMKWWRTFQAI